MWWMSFVTAILDHVLEIDTLTCPSVSHLVVWMEPCIQLELHRPHRTKPGKKNLLKSWEFITYKAIRQASIH